MWTDEAFARVYCPHRGPLDRDRAALWPLKSRGPFARRQTHAQVPMRRAGRGCRRNKKMPRGLVACSGRSPTQPETAPLSPCHVRLYTMLNISLVLRTSSCNLATLTFSTSPCARSASSPRSRSANCSRRSRSSAARTAGCRRDRSSSSGSSVYTAPLQDRNMLSVVRSCVANARACDASCLSRGST